MTFNTHIHEWHQKTPHKQYVWIYIYISMTGGAWQVWKQAYKSLAGDIQNKQLIFPMLKKPQPFWIYLYNLRPISYQPVLFIHLRQPFCCLCTLSGSLFYLLSCWVSDCVRQGISLLSLFPYCIFVEVEAAQSVNNTVQNRQKDRNPFKALSSSQTNCEKLTLQVSHKILPIA